MKPDPRIPMYQRHGGDISRWQSQVGSYNEVSKPANDGIQDWPPQSQLAALKSKITINATLQNH